MGGHFLSILFVLALCWANTDAQLKIVSVVDASLTSAPSWLNSAVAAAQTSTGENMQLAVLKISIDDETSAEKQLCAAVFDGVAAILDLTAGGWTYGQTTADSLGIPYVHGQISISQHMEATDLLLQNRNATDAALIFGAEAELDQALYYLVQGSSVRVIVLVGLGSNSIMSLRKMRPAPAYYVLFGTGQEATTMFSQAVKAGFVTRDSRWTVVITGTDPENFKPINIPGTTTITMVAPTSQICCTATNTSPPCRCNNIVVPEQMIVNLVLTLATTLKGGANVIGDCEAPPATAPGTDVFTAAFRREVENWKGVIWNGSKRQVLPVVRFDYSTANGSRNTDIGFWSTDRGIQLNPSFKNTPIKRFFRIGSLESRPWFYSGSETAEISFESYEGYCVELAMRLSKMMEFDFTFVKPKDKKFGGKMPNGSWNGLVADLANGVTDLVVAPLTMTSEREEVIDFVAPYFDQSGISIVIRKRVRPENLFKFMTVLKGEVWVSIVAALVVTGIMLWLLDRYSPYSAQNNSEKYPASARKFTLKESFWFALTSFTPQGGGEAPKALSGRTLVAAYWLFVVLMLATFTANLAAFLTVERMQTPVSSLEELAGQSKINYTVMDGSSVLQYFSNMAGAEEELYRVWKELTLNSTTDQSKYRVWDYPIKEQYTHILQVIDDTVPVVSSEKAFEMVLDNLQGEFAFIHDASEIRYEIYNNCFLSEVGEPFAEQPYAIAVQQGSYLQEEISRAILELQKERYFESLLAKFWNSSARSDCSNDDDSEGITLKSLGGVFIATLIGLVLALIALAVEVMYYRQKGSSQVQDISPQKMRHGGLEGKMIMPMDKEQISRISVAPAY